MRNLVVLGSTGSIGTQTLDVVRDMPDRLRVVGLSAHRNSELLAAQAAEFGVTRTALLDRDSAHAAGVPGGLDAIEALTQIEEADVVVVAVAGVVGLAPTVAAILAGKDVALASKEVLVAAGSIVMPLVREHGTRLTPIDSEHSAIFQCLEGRSTEDVAKLIITASGGPFRGRTREQLMTVSREQALDHPTWKMGGKITVDSATLMNKGLETVEAHWLFGVPITDVEIVVHPQSIVHSFVRLRDGSVIAQLGWPNMRLPIQFALLAPERVPNSLPPWEPELTPTLTFERPDFEAFPAPRLAVRSVELGGTMPAVMNAANEEAVTIFLSGGCGFLAITDAVERAMDAHDLIAPSLESIVECDRWARETVRSYFQSG